MINPPRKYIKIMKRNIISIILLITILFIFSFYISNTDQNEIRDLSHKITNKTGIDLPMLFYNFESAVNILRPKNDLMDKGLPIYDFMLSKKDVAHFNNLSKQAVNQGYLDKGQLNPWRDAKLRLDGTKYDVKIKLHGDLAVHWANHLKSFKVKMLDDSINRISRFNLLIFEDDLFFPRILRIVSYDFGLFDIRDDFVTLSSEGKLLGFYYLQESLDKDFLEYNKCSNCEMIQVTDNMLRDHTKNLVIEDKIIPVKNPYSVGYLGSHITPFDFELSNVDFDESDLNIEAILFKVDNLFQAVKDEDIIHLVDYFDIDQITSFEAIRMLFGAGPSVDGDNLRLIYSATNSKFYPIAKEGKILKIKLERGGFEHRLNQRGDFELKLFALLNRDDQIRQLKYKKVYDYIKNEGQELLEKVDKQINYYLPYINSHKANKIGTKPLEKIIKSYEPDLKSNMETIQQALEYSKAYIGVVEQENRLKLEIIPDSLSRLKITSFKVYLENMKYSGKITMDYKDKNGKILTKLINIEDKSDSLDLTEMIKDIYFSTGLDKDMFPQKRTYIVSLTLEGADEINLKETQFEIQNDITGNYLKEEDIYLQIAKGDNYYDNLIDASPAEIIDKYPELDLSYEGNELTLSSGEYVLKRDLIIPKLLTLNIQANTKILIDYEKSIVSYSPINILGEKEKPVTITALNPKKPFGTFAIVGDETQTSTINWLELSGGNEKWVNGIYFSGGLSIHHMNVYMSNTKIFNNNADDGLNVKYGEVMIDNCLFIDNFADQIDLDFVDGTVKNSQFKENDPDADSNGDGLDISGSKTLVKNNDFIGFQDKGISIGEETIAVLYGNKIANNNLGVAVKDLSQVYFLENLFKNNNIAISSYQKKLLFGGGSSYLYNNLYESNMKEYGAGEKSQKYNINIPNEKEIRENINEEEINRLFENIKQVEIEESEN